MDRASRSPKSAEQEIGKSQKVRFILAHFSILSWLHILKREDSTKLLEPQTDYIRRNGQTFVSHYQKHKRFDFQ